jgi:hypothetical protein
LVPREPPISSSNSVSSISITKRKLTLRTERPLDLWLLNSPQREPSPPLTVKPTSRDLKFKDLSPQRDLEEREPLKELKKKEERLPTNKEKLIKIPLRELELIPRNLLSPPLPLKRQLLLKLNK